MTNTHYMKGKLMKTLQEVSDRHEASRLMTVLRMALSDQHPEVRVKWRIEPHWEGFAIIGKLGNPLISPNTVIVDGDGPGDDIPKELCWIPGTPSHVCHIEEDENILNVVEHIQTQEFIDGLTTEDRDWYLSMAALLSPATSWLKYDWPIEVRGTWFSC